MILRVLLALLAVLALTRASRPWPFSADVETDPARAVALHPRSTSLRTAYALALEKSGKLAEAETQLLEAARNDHLYATAWQLSDFYFRHQQPDDFLKWAHLAAERSYSNLSALFRLADSLGISANNFRTQLLIRPAIERNYVAWLLEKNRLSEIDPIAKLLAARNQPEDRDLLMAFVDALISHGDATQARDAWQLFDPLLPAGSLLVNPDFRRQPLARGFDWRPVAMDGVRQFLANTTDPSESGWTLELSGRQPELSELLTQYVVLEPGQTYTISTDTLCPDAGSLGFVWLLQGTELPVSKSLTRIRAVQSLNQLILRYRRPPGQTRFEGRLTIHRVNLAIALANPQGR